MFNIGYTNTVAASDEGRWIHLTDLGNPMYAPAPDGSPDLSKPLMVKLRGPHSPILQRAEAKMNAEQVKKNGKVDFNKMSIEETTDLLMDVKKNDPRRWAHATIEWKNFPEGMECNFQTAYEVWSKNPQAIEQFTNEAGDIKDFMKLAVAS